MNVIGFVMLGRGTAEPGAMFCCHPMIQTEVETMTDDMEIAVMCEVARSGGHDLSRDQRTILDGVIARGYVVPVDDTGTEHARLKLTPAGQAVLDERGVGANES